MMMVFGAIRILLSLVFTLFLSLPFRTTSPSLFAFPLVPTLVAVAVVHLGRQGQERRDPLGQLREPRDAHRTRVRRVGILGSLEVNP